MYISYFRNIKYIRHILYARIETAQQIPRNPTKQSNAIWNKGAKIPGKNLKEYRRDVYGTVIQRFKYGKRITGGWEKDHTLPPSRGGTNHVDNLTPLYWVTNVHKSNSLKKKRCEKS